MPIIDSLRINNVSYDLSDPSVDEKLLDIRRDMHYSKKILYALDIDTDLFNKSSSEGYWGKKRLFDPTYIKSITINGQLTGTVDSQISVVLCDENYEIINKSFYIYTPSLVTVEVPIDFDAKVPFYVLVRCPGMYFANWYSSEYSTKTIKGNWGTIGYQFVGDIASIIEEESNIEFDVSLNVISINDHSNGFTGIAEDVYSYNPYDVFDIFKLQQRSIGDKIYGSSFLYPEGFIKTITLAFYGSTTDRDVAIFITDSNKKILKKAVGYDNGSLDEQTYLINYYATEPVYIFVRSPRLIWDVSTIKTGEKYKIFHGQWGVYGYKTAGEILFTDWDNGGELSSTIFAIQANYDNRQIIKYQKRERIYALQDAYRQWLYGEKFPICVIGDSTTDGDTTTGATPNVIGTDHVDPNTYTTKLQGYLREALNNNVLRIYNAGFSGRSVSWALENIDGILFDNEYYSDSKIAIISHGINDYVNNYNRERWYRDHLSQLVEILYDHGIQPVIMTTQAGMENHGRFGWMQQSIADKVSIEVANKYNLEIMDKNVYTSLFNIYSSLSISSIIPDGCHYGDAGHLFVAGMMFADLVPFTVWAFDGETILGFADERLRTELEYSSEVNYRWKDVKVITPSNGFKLEARCSKSAETVLMDFWVYVIGKKQKTLISYCTTPNTQRVIVDGNLTSISTSQQTIGNLEMGLHHIVVKALASDSVNYLGLKLVDVGN